MSDPAAAVRPLAQLYDVALLDLDGVVYLGALAVPGAVEALRNAELLGLRRVFVTNNASRTPDVIARQLVSLGIAVHVDEIVTSAQTAARRLVDLVPPGSLVLVVGGHGLVEAVQQCGFVPVFSADDGPAAVVQGFSPTVTWQMLMEACVAVRAGLPWIVTNADATVPTPRGEGPGNGALVDVVRAATGRVPDEVTGKPFAPIMRQARGRLHADRPLVVGDRLDTDIQAARSAGMDSLLVLTGVTTVLDLLNCPPGRRPTYLAPGLDGLLQPPRVPTEQDGWWHCGAAAVRLVRPTHRPASPVMVEVRIGSHEVSMDEPSPALDAPTIADLVHAAAAARWSWRDRSPDVTTEVRAALSSWAAPLGWDR